MRPEPAFADLVALMDRLRDPGGCPWDREQTYATLRGYLVEECYEVVDAIDRDDRALLREELGDLLFQIVFLSRLAQEEEAFTVGDVIAGIADKMRRRHPHVFGDDVAEDSAAVLTRWEEIKKEEKTLAGRGAAASVLDGIPASLPALAKAHRLGTKAARVGFDWADDRDVVAKVEEEIEEIKRALVSGDSEGAAREIGDAIFSLAMLARRVGTDAEAALAGTNAAFVDRFRFVEAELARRGVAVDSAGLTLLDRLWQEAKTRRPER
jgi:MazG family protein